MNIVGERSFSHFLKMVLAPFEFDGVWFGQLVQDVKNRFATMYFGKY